MPLYTISFGDIEVAGTSETEQQPVSNSFFWSYQYLPVAQGDSFRVLTPGCVTPVYWEPSSCFSSSSTAAGGCTRSQAWRRLSATGDKNICTCSTMTLFLNLNLNLDSFAQPCVNIDEKKIFWSTLCRPGLLLYPVNSWCYPANSQVYSWLNPS